MRLNRLELGQSVKIRDLEYHEKFAIRDKDDELNHFYQKLVWIDSFKLNDDYKTIDAFSSLYKKTFTLSVDDDCIWLGNMSCWSYDGDGIRDNNWRLQDDYSYHPNSKFYPVGFEDKVNGLIFITKKVDEDINMRKILDL